ncbi:hypothetical protein HII31_04486 [Pseudocercospora fuligena]|uniref:Uncharacterized protein n=1 Tax=Pseudocercospora fuligena TaxID=685502 RepID=A0A8H6VN39_9PEZI|nr:hypothetical protein HII31_04486 [Pseudocercospora fuligena]
MATPDNLLNGKDAEIGLIKRWHSRDECGSCYFDERSDAEREQQRDCKCRNEKIRTKAWRHLYLILTAMFMALFVINILQISLISETQNVYWIALCPALVFVGFLAYTVVYYSSKAAQKQAWHTSWSTYVARVGVVATVLGTIVMCEFVWMNAVAVPSAKDLQWSIDFNAAENISSPAIAVLQYTQIRRQATLDGNATHLDTWCTTGVTSNGSRGCFRDHEQYFSSRLARNISYLTFDMSVLSPVMNTSSIFDIGYNFKYDNETTDPILSIAVFDSALLSDFQSALDCRIINPTLFQAGGTLYITAEPYQITDDLNAMHRSSKDNCDSLFRSYTAFRTSTSPLVDFGSPTHCSTSDPDSGYCHGDVRLVLSSLLTTMYTSKRGTDWKKMFTDEGGIAGGIALLTWFCGIFLV